MNLVDSSGWVEYFLDGPRANVFSSPLSDTRHLIVPSICLLEVFKVILRERDESIALRSTVLMQQGLVVELDSELALEAAKLSYQLKLPAADSIILATARKYHATIWTQDSDFENIENVKLIKKK